ncbi:MAG: MBL fold metallo-hydrolase [Peptococcaceae bacterium]|nr:MBL fold metallo-hydrolase [Peptococcaceae bacterium]
MKLAFYGAAHEVTGSCTILYANGKTILIDCGLEQGPDIYENCTLPFAPSQIDYVLLTHAHIDHSGKLPSLTAEGFRGKIYATAATVKLCNIMLLDSAHIQEAEAKWRNRKAKRSGGEHYVPLYTIDDAAHTLKQFVPCSYDTPFELCKGITVSFIDAGHLLGSSSISITVTEGGHTETIVFSGDLGNYDRPLINNPKTPKEADYVIIESTYGNRLHGERPDYVSQLTQILQETFDRGGNVVIPSFAIGRTQELLYLFRVIKEQKLIHGHENFPVYVDSPLAVEATEIYGSNLTEYFDEETLELLKKGINPIKLPGLTLSISSDDSVAINLDKTPKVILSASGMCEAGRIRHHLKHNLWRRECTILFVGYQAVGTLGSIIVNGASEVKLFGETIQVNAQIAQMEGISGHADRDMLLGWLDGFEKKPKMVFVNHGQDTVCDEFAQTITDRLGLKTVAPYNGAEYDLVSGAALIQGNTKRIEKRTQQCGKQKETPAFRDLLAAGRWLMAIIEKYRDGAATDLKKFAKQIIALCEKWDK